MVKITTFDNGPVRHVRHMPDGSPAAADDAENPVVDVGIIHRE
jgi:hypothetical protein